MKVRLLFAFILFCGCLLARGGESETMHWTIEGTERKALVFVPSASTAGGAPVIFAFHGHGQDTDFASRRMAFQDLWPEALVVYMQGLPTKGRVGDPKGLLTGWQHHPGELGDRDLKFFDAVLSRLREKYSVDDRRIYATGFSNGGFFTYLLWAERPNIFAAFAPGGGTILPSFHLTQPRPALHYGGQRDQLVKFVDQQQTIDEVRKLNGCAEHGQPCGANCTLYSSSIGAPLETFIHAWGHIYPLKIGEMIVKFFQEHPRNP